MNNNELEHNNNKTDKEKVDIIKNVEFTGYNKNNPQHIKSVKQLAKYAKHGVKYKHAGYEDPEELKTNIKKIFFGGDY